jgi:hypothetical protein
MRAYLKAYAGALAVMIPLVSMPCAAPAAVGVTWNGVTLGVPVSTLRATLGDPLRVVASDDAATRIGRYWIPGSDATFFLLIEKRGYVVGFRAFSEEAVKGLVANVPPDPGGVHLGDTMQSVKTSNPELHATTGVDGAEALIGHLADRSAGMSYDFEDGLVRGFQWGAADAVAADAAPLTDPAGDSIATAVLDTQKNERDGVRWEYLYVGYHPCDGQTMWKLSQQALTREGGRSYDRLHVVCPTTKAERDFYFDITGYLGKS